MLFLSVLFVICKRHMLHSGSHFSTKIVQRYKILKIHVIKGYDATGKAEIKKTALKANYHLLASFWQIEGQMF